MAFEIQQARNFLKILGYKAGEKIALRFFYPSTDNRKVKDKGRKAEILLKNGWAQTIEQYQEEGRGAYLVINKGGSKDSEITECLAIFCEWDNLEKSIQVDLWRSLKLPEPTIQVDTGGKSIHCYWVLDAPIGVEAWRGLQARLLEYADADRTLKNPSRVMRLPGAHYMGGKNPAISKIIGGCEKKYSFKELSDAIPIQEVKTQKTTWAQFDGSFSLPYLDRVPLITCLQKKSRERIESGTTGERNQSGAQLARDLIGTAQHLQSIGQLFSGDPYQLFLQYCEKCPQNDWNPTEWENIWRSAEKDNPGPSLSPEEIENCIKGWAWRNRVSNDDAPTRDETPSLTSELKQAKEKLRKQEDFLEQLGNEQIQLESQIDEIDQEILAINQDQELAYHDREFKLSALNQERGIKLEKLRRIKEQIRGLRSDRHSQRVQFNALRKEKARSDKESEPTAFEKDLEAIGLIEGLAFNTLTQCAELNGLPLELDHPRAELSRLTGYTAWETSDNSVTNMLLDAAKQKSYCPIQQYLELATNRHQDASHTFLDNLAERIFGATSEVQNAFLKAFLIGSAKRAFEPGCEHTYMMVLHSSKQGKGKSTFVRTLFGKDFAGEGQINFDVDALLALNQSWVHEIGECDQAFSHRANTSSKVKDFISLQADTYRAPYGRSSKRHNRRTVLIGTTNHREFLTDETGNRRFAVIDIPDGWDIPNNWVAQNRDYIWACAMDGFQKGVPNVIPERLFKDAELEAEEFLEVDPWEETIAEYVHKFNSVEMREILDNCLKIEMGRKTLAEQRRVGRILTKLGWKKKKTRRNGLNKYLWQRVLDISSPCSPDVLHNIEEIGNTSNPDDNYPVDSSSLCSPSKSHTHIGKKENVEPTPDQKDEKSYICLDSQNRGSMESSGLEVNNSNASSCSSSSKTGGADGEMLPIGSPFEFGEEF